MEEEEVAVGAGVDEALGESNCATNIDVRGVEDGGVGLSPEKVCRSFICSYMDNELLIRFMLYWLEFSLDETHWNEILSQRKFLTVKQKFMVLNFHQTKSLYGFN